MNERPGASTDFARTLSQWLDDLAPDREPPDLLMRVLDQTATTSRRPAWWRPGWAMDGLSRPRFVVGRAFAVAAHVVLLGIAMVVALGVSSRPHLPVPLGRPGVLVVARGDELDLVDPSTGIVRVVPTGEMYGAGAWSPDGSRLAHADGSPTNPFLVIAAADLTEQLRLRLPVGANPDFSWSPDGRRIAFDAGTDTTNQVFVIDVVPGAVALPVADAELHGIRPSWSPDGEWIAFRGGVGLDQQALYVTHPDGSGVRRVSDHARAVNPWCGFPWTPDSRSILFETAYNGVWFVDVDGSHERVAVGGTDQAYCPSMAPDGKRIAAVVDTGFGKQVTILAIDGSSRVVPRSPGFFWPGAIWSPDAKTVVTSTGDEHGKQGPIAIFDAAGLEPPRLIPITDGEVVDWQRLPG